MTYYNTANHLSFILVICISFSILIFSFLLNKEKNLTRLMGACFIIPFILVIAAAQNRNVTLSNSLFSFAQLSLLFSILIIIMVKPKSKSHGLIIAIFCSYPFILLISVSYSKSVEHFISVPLIYTIFIMVISLVIMFVLRKEKGNGSLIFWAALVVLTESTMRLVSNGILTDYFALVCHIFIYIMMLLYFHREIVKRILGKIEQAEKQLEAVDKNLNLEVRKRVLEIERSNEVLVNISRTDALTKALNKTAILDTIGNLISSAKPGAEFSILMFDIDRFKTINDTLGHIVGDKCIKKLALIARNSLREIDSLGRYGGDEFIIVLPDTTTSQAKLVAERFRKRVAETESPHFTVSIGISTYPQDGNSVKDLISAADDGLYQSKSKGRNCVSYKNVF